MRVLELREMLQRRYDVIKFILISSDQWLFFACSHGRLLFPQSSGAIRLCFRIVCLAFAVTCHLVIAPLLIFQF